MAKLSTSQRKAIPKSSFAIPSKAPKSGSYPINDRSHAQNALARSSGKPVAGKVRAAVLKKYPSIGKGTQKSTLKNPTVSQRITNANSKMK